MSVVSPQVPARLRRAFGRFVGPAGAALFSLVLASCAGGGFGGAGDASDISGVNPVSQPAPVASGPISPASQRKVAEAVSDLDLGEETPPISPEDIAVSNDSGILDSNPFSSPAPAARSSNWGALADSTRKTAGYKAFEIAVPSENPLMTVAVWISETPPDYPEGKPEQDPEADRKFLYLRLQVFIAVEHVALVEGGGVEVLETSVIVVEEKRPDPKPQPQPTVVAEPLPACGAGEFRDGEGSCLPILGADLLCPSGTMPANGLAQAELDAGLISAAQANNLEDVCEHLRRGASVEAQEQSGTYRRTALMIAAYDRYLELAKLLHANGADVNSRVGNGGMGGRANPGRWRTHGDSGFTALMYAAGAAGAAGSAEAAGRAEMVGWLLDNGADPNLGDSRGRVPLFEAAFYGRVDVMGLLLDGGADVDGTDVWGLAPLHAAGPHYNYGSGPEWSYAATVAGYLLSRGADVNARDSWGRSPLDMYAEWSHPNAAAVLRNAGGKCFVQTGPLCEVVDVVTAETVCESGSLLANGLTQAQLDAGLLSEARDNDLAGVCEYLRRGADVDAHDAASHYLRTALMHSAANGYLELAKLLHANGADLDDQGGTHHLNSNRSWRWAALHYAAAAGHAEMVRWLLDAGADLEILSREDRSPLWEAAYWGRLDVVELLLSRGADANRAGIAGESAVWGVVYAAVGAVTYRSDWEGWDNGRSHLLAVPSGYLPLVGGSWLSAISLLASDGADVNAATRFPNRSVARSPLDLAIESGSEKYAALLRGLGGTCLVETGPLCGVVEVATPDPVTLEAVTAETVCESGSLSANGLTQAQLDAGLLSEARDNDLEGVCEYLRRGADVDAHDAASHYLRTALMHSAANGYLELAKLLHANGADLDHQGGTHLLNSNRSWRWAALHYAAAAGHVEMARWLLDAGADLEVLSREDRSPLWEAASWGRLDVVEFLLSRGADPNRAGIAGESAVWGVVYAAVGVVTYRSDWEGWDNGRSHLLAVPSGYLPLVGGSWLSAISLLVSNGADVNAATRFPNRSVARSPLDLAIESGSEKYAALLRGLGGTCLVETGPLCGEVHVAVGFSSSGSGTVSAEGGGGALSDGDDVRQGATVVFTATPAAGHYVSGWSGNCAEVGEVADGLDGAAKFCAAAADSDLSVRAEFSEIPSLAGPLCPSGSLSANGLAQAELDAGLISAAQANNLEDVCEYLRRGASVEAQEQSGTYRRTALMIAAYDRYLELAKLLHANGADVNSRVGNGGMGGRANPGRWRTHGDSGFTALMYAAGAAGAAGSAEAAGRAEMVGWLLDNGADPNLGDSRGRVPLFEAAFYGRVDVMGLLLDGGADVDGTDVWGLAPLHAAGPHYNYGSGPEWSYAATVAGYLLSRGANVNALDSWGRSPLDMYAEWSHPNAAAVLRNAGGKCFVQTGPLCGVDVAVGFSSSGSGTVSAEGGGGALSDGDEVRQGATVMFTATPAAGHYVSGWSGNCAEAGEVADGLDGTAKVCAAAADSALSVRAEFSEIPSLAGPLCPSGSLSANGLTQAELDAGLVSAAQANNLEDVCEHLRRGASVEAQEQSGTYRRTALMIAAYDRYLDLAKLLHANGADVNSRVGNGGGGGTAWPGRWNTHADTGFSALMYAAGAAGAAGSAEAAGRAEMVGWLLDNGADPNLGDSRGRLPLWEAAHYGRVEVMGLLLDGGADVDGADVWGVVPLQAAGPHYDRFSKWSFAATVVGYLLSRGAEVNARDIWGRSPLDVYAEWSHRNVAAVLRNAGGKCFVQTGPLCGVDVAVGFSSSGSGTVSAEGDGGALSDGDEVRQGATVVFTAAPAAGHYVSGWSGNCAEAGEVADGLDGTAKVCAAAADSDLSVRAEFSEIPSLAGSVVPVGFAFGERERVDAGGVGRGAGFGGASEQFGGCVRASAPRGERGSAGAERDLSPHGADDSGV